MNDRYDRDRIDTRYDGEAGGGSFVMGLLTGTVLGAGLGMLFAPKAGSELRNQISEQAGSLATNAQDGYRRAGEAAQEGYRRAGEVATDLADKGRGVVDRARDAVSRGADEASRYAREASDQAKSTASSVASNFGSGSGPYGSGGSHS